MEFQFKTTRWKSAEGTKWGSWIYMTNTLRQVSIWTYVVLFALLTPVGMLFMEIVWAKGSTWMITVSVVLLCLGMCAVFIPREVNWKRWKKSFFEALDMRPEDGGEDGDVIYTFSENGASIETLGENREMFPWKKVDALCESGEWWDIITYSGQLVLSLRKDDLIGGDTEAFAAFLQQKSKKKLKPRAIELSELQRRFPR